MKKVLLEEEINRINELLGNKQRIDEQMSAFIKGLVPALRDDFLDVARTLFPSKVIRKIDDLAEAEVLQVLKSSAAKMVRRNIYAEITRKLAMNSTKFASKTSIELMRDLRTLGVKDPDIAAAYLKKFAKDNTVDTADKKFANIIGGNVTPGPNVKPSNIFDVVDPNQSQSQVISSIESFIEKNSKGLFPKIRTGGLTPSEISRELTSTIQQRINADIATIEKDFLKLPPSEQTKRINEAIKRLSESAKSKGESSVAKNIDGLKGLTGKKFWSRFWTVYQISAVVSALIDGYQMFEGEVNKENVKELARNAAFGPFGAAKNLFELFGFDSKTSESSDDSGDSEEGGVEIDLTTGELKNK